MNHTWQAIGTVHSPFLEATGTPLQNFAAAAHEGGLAETTSQLGPNIHRDVRGGRGTIEITPEWEEALRDLDGFDRIWVLFHLHISAPPKPLVTPFRDVVQRGLFATRAPSRPNGIGLSAVRLLGISGRFIHVAELDILDGSPVLDIKPYIPDYDSRPEAKRGWLESKSAQPGVVKADKRFEAPPAR